MLAWWMLAGGLAAEPVATQPSLWPGPPSRAVRAAYAAMHAGRLAAAARGFAGVREPYHLAHAGELAMRRGEAAEAERLWAAAREGFRDVGATVRVVPQSGWQTRVISWRGEELAELQWPERFELAGAVRLQMRSTRKPTRTLLVPIGFEMALSGDEVLIGGGGGTRAYDLTTGLLQQSWPEANGGHGLLVFGTGEGRRLLAHGKRVEIFEGGRDEPVASYAEDGVKVVASAMSADGRWVALGREDGQVRVHDRERGTNELLKFAWEPLPAREHEVRPASNEALALGFDAGGRLVAVHRQGDILLWDVRSGRRLQRHAGACTQEELLAGQDDELLFRAPRDPDVSLCGRLEVAAIAGDGASVAVGGERAIRVRSVESGRTLRFVWWRRAWGSAGFMADLFGQSLRTIGLSDAGTVAVADDGGVTMMWPRGEPVTELSAARPWISEVELLADGRVLKFSLGDQGLLIDMTTGERAELGSHAAVSRNLRMVLWTERELVAWPAAADELQIRRRLVDGPLATRRLKGGESVAEVRVAESGHVAIQIEQEGQPYRSMVILGPDGREIAVRLLRGELEAISADGRWLSTREVVSSADERERVETWRVWSTTRPGGPVHAHSLRRAGSSGFTTEDELVFARDGEHMAWSVRPRSEEWPTIVRVRRLNDSPDVREREFPGESGELVFTMDGAEVLLTDGEGGVLRWRWATDELRQHERVRATGIQPSADGRVVFMQRGDSVEIRRNDETLRRVATVHALGTSGWLVMSESGAVDGSEDARDSVVTRVTRGVETLVFGGGLGWSGAHVDGLLARALSGEDVALPDRR